MNDVVIRAEGLGKKYVIGQQTSTLERYKSLRDVVGRKVKGLGRAALNVARGRNIVASDELEEFWALKDVSFEIRRGEVVGIIGRNGAGKSTLLKVLSRITEPTEGRASLRGRIASLLEVGTGFHPELTGRENIYLNGAILGMARHEIKVRFDAIVDFAEIEKFLDTPVKRYSSGMYVRLAFAVAAHLDPEILVVDEVLAVGDAEFQRKCLGKMSEVAGGGRTVLVVSHNMPMVKNLCSRAIVLAGGRSAFDGGVEPAIQHFLHSANAGGGQSLKARTDRRGDGRLRFTEVRVEGTRPDILRMGEEARIGLFYDAEQEIRDAHFVFHVENAWGQTILRLATRESGSPMNIPAGNGSVTCSISQIQLLPGQYTLLIAASTSHYEYMDYVNRAVVFEVVENDVYGTGRIPQYGEFFSMCTWSRS